MESGGRGELDELGGLNRLGYMSFISLYLAGSTTKNNIEGEGSSELDALE